jgi:hypothetical protein
MEAVGRGAADLGGNVARPLAAQRTHY